MNNKKIYQTPQTLSVAVEPLSILCASSMFIDPTPGNGLVGG